MSSSTRRSIRFGAPAVIGALLVSVVLGSSAGAAQSPVGLGTATSFSVLAGSGITNTGPTTVNGDIGSFPTPTITGDASITFTPPAVNHAGDAVTQSAKADLLAAYNDAGSRLPNIAQDGELGGELKTEGVYQGGATLLTGDLTLDFQGSSTSQFVFKLTELTTAVNSRVLLTNTGGNDACRVVWQISSSATFGTGTQFVGDVLTHTSITATTGATFQGRLLALNGAVTLDTNTINIGSCAVVPAAVTTTTTAFVPTPVTAAPTTTSTTSTTVRRATTTSTTSTTTAPTTTTAVLPTTTTVVAAPVVVAAVPTPPVGVDLQVAAPPSTAPVTPPPGRPELPRTGTETLPLAVIGVGMVVVGAGIVRLEERTRPSRARR